MHTGFFCQCERHTRAALHEAMHLATYAEMIVDNLPEQEPVTHIWGIPTYQPFHGQHDNFATRAIAYDAWAMYILNRIEDIEEGRNQGFE